MLSVDKILIFLFIGIFTSSLYAVDVSNFDIKGIKLGMSKSEVLKKIPCNSPDIYTEKIGNSIITETLIRCYEKKNDSYFGITLDHNHKVYFINKRISFEVKPNLNKIKKQLISKYKKPKIITKQVPGYANDNTGYYKKFCWGGCKTKIVNSKYFKGNEIKTTNYVSLVVEYADFYITDGGSHDNRIEFTLKDPKSSSNNYDWTKKQEKIYEKQQKEKASNIDF